MSTETVQKLIWVLIYGGLLLLGLGLSVARSDGSVGAPIAVFGALTALAGVVLIVVRSRMKD